ncbi:MAG: pyridoxamine 5'-phosphate oxidase family protein [Anaerolinea sp.]|nr:pyridoxamine 5'-phosphate oxidase family protein [Anaerolinea sp.]
MAVTLNEVRDVLAQPVIARLGTIGADGFPHITPLWFLFEGDDLVIMADRTARKAQNLIANPRGAVQIGGDPLSDGQDGYTPGVMLQGDFTVEDDPDHAVTARITRHYLHGAAAEHLLETWKDDDIVVLRLKIRKVIRVAG